MSVPRCTSGACAGVADDGTGLCAAHRGALTLSTKMQDAVREYVNARHWYDVIKPTDDNARKVVEAGEHLARGMALLISTRFDDVSFDPSPLFAVDLRRSATTPWRVSFAWNANEIIELDDDTEDDDDDDQRLESDEP